MSMLKICGQELELDLFDADTMEVYEKSMDKVVKSRGNQEAYRDVKRRRHPGDVRNRKGFLR